MFMQILLFLEDPRTAIVIKDMPGHKPLLARPTGFDGTELF
jgi:hypothetical protein